MWYKDRKLDGWVMFKGNGYYYGWSANIAWKYNTDTSLESYDVYEYPCSKEEVVEQFIKSALEYDIVLLPFDLDNLDLDRLVNISMLETINNIMYDVRKVELDKLCD